MFKSCAGLYRGSCQQKAPQTDEHLDSKRLWNDWHSLSCKACSHLAVGLKGVQEKKPVGHTPQSALSDFSASVVAQHKYAVFLACSLPFASYWPCSTVVLSLSSRGTVSSSC